MANTALSLITSAARLINVVASGETLEISEANDGLMVFQQMIDSWNAERLIIFTTSSQDFPFVLGKQSYTMGPGGDFNTARPAQIDAMSAILLYDPANPVEEPITMYSVDEWQTNVPVKNVAGSFPQVCYDSGDFPLRVLNFWPIPNTQNSVRIYSWAALAAPAVLTTAIAFPPGYAQAIRFNLALLLAAEYGAPVPAIVQTTAMESLARVKTINAPDMGLTSDLAPTAGGYNWRADLFGIGW